MNILIIGTGGVGGYFGGRIAKYCEKNPKNKVYFIARGEHLKKIKEDGLTIKSADEGTFICRPFWAGEDFNELPMIDICLIAVKGYDLENILYKAADKIKEDTEIMPLLNGIDIAEKVRKIINKGILYPACVYIGTHIEKPGIIAQSGGSCTIKFGNERNDNSSNGRRICSLLDNAQIKYEYSSRNYEEIWSKYMFIASYGLVSSFYNKTLGEIYENEILSIKVKSIMELIKELSYKEKICLPDNIVEDSYNKAKAFPYETKTSFQRDYENKAKKDERDTFGKSIIELAKKHDINCECISEIYENLEDKLS